MRVSIRKLPANNRIFSFMGRKRKFTRHPHQNFEYLCLPHSLALSFPWYFVLVRIQITIVSLSFLVQILILLFYRLNALNKFKSATFLLKNSHSFNYKRRELLL
ncbi:unnamed protein product [Ceratitis capitata]|uniref:(Mediterranean fruit fly) hypothetical protein n=1 Tax=Ceratitis capitata TaxID=7213 RepID=A0A811U6G4_CERCA|nr:unnamed protein product [Ceratitis capitata]